MPVPPHRDATATEVGIWGCDGYQGWNTGCGGYRGRHMRMRQLRTRLVRANEKSHLAFMMTTLPSLIAVMLRSRSPNSPGRLIITVV